MWSLWAVFAILALTGMNLFCLLMWAGAHKRETRQDPRPWTSTSPQFAPRPSVGAPACSSSPVKRKSRGGEMQALRQIERFDNERTRGQTGLTAGPAAHRPTGWKGDPPQKTHTSDSHLREIEQPLTLDLHLPTTLYIFCCWIWKKKRDSGIKRCQFTARTHERKRKRDRIL